MHEQEQVPILEKLTSRCMSDDEDVQGPMGRERRIRVPAWRSQLLADYLHVFDAYRRYYCSVVGQPDATPRRFTDLTEVPIFINSEFVVRGLPDNAYDPDWVRQRGESAFIQDIAPDATSLEFTHRPQVMT